MDNERDVLERELVKEVSELPLDLKDPADQYWFIETELLRIRELEATVCREQNETQRISAEAQVVEAKARLLEAQNEALRLKAANPATTTLEVSCTGCGSDFKMTSTDPEQVTECYDKFSYQHSSCT